MSQLTPTFHLSDFENLQEDLVLLQTSLEQKRVQPERARAQCVEILAAVAHLSAEQQLPAYGSFVGLLVEFVRDAAHPQAALGEEFWALTLDVLDELLAALEMADAGLKVDMEAMRRHITAFEGRLSDLPTTEAAAETAPEGGGNGEVEEGEPSTQPEPAAPPTAETAPAPAEENGEEQSPQVLLQMAAEAAAAGRHEEAQELATAAASGLAVTARNRKQTELAELRDKLTVVEAERESAKTSLRKAQKALAKWGEQMEAARADQEQAAARLEATAGSVDEIKGKLEEIERRMAKLQAAQEKLMANFEEALPAKESAAQAHEEATARLEEAATGGGVVQAQMQELEESLAELRPRRDGLQDRIAALEAEIGD